MSKPRALIIGGSLGGLIAAHLLRAAGWDAVVFERNAEDLLSRGAGIGTHPHLIDILRRAGIAFDDSMGVPVATALALDRDGKVALRQETVRMMSGWARLYRSLRAPLPADRYVLAHALERVEQDDAGVTAMFAGGARERGDLLVGADGIRSTVRAQYLPHAQPVYAGYVAWRAMVAERDIPEAIRAEIFECYAFCLPDGEQCLGYPVPGGDNDTANDTVRKTSRPSPYPNDTSRNSIVPRSSLAVTAPGRSVISGSMSSTSEMRSALAMALERSVESSARFFIGRYRLLRYETTRTSAPGSMDPRSTSSAPSSTAAAVPIAVICSEERLAAAPSRATRMLSFTVSAVTLSNRRISCVSRANACTSGTADSTSPMRDAT